MENCDNPFWLADLQEELPKKLAYDTPLGPFYNDEHRLFARSVGELASMWLGRRAYVGQQSAENSYRLMLPDRRAFITTFRAEANQLQVSVDSVPGLQLRCVAYRRGFRGESEQLVHEVADGVATFHFGGGVQDLNVWLVTADGEFVDEYFENEHRASWGRSIYNAPRSDVDRPYAELHAALAAGESDTVEFKAWIPPHRNDDKAQELLRVSCAFANTSGGSVYIGVDDNAQLRGVGKELRGLQGRAAPTDQARQEGYVRDLRKLISEGIRPTPEVRFDWVEVAGISVLRVTVQKSDTPHSLVESGDIYVRAGATSRKARPDEYLAVTAGRFPLVGPGSST